MSSKKFKDKSCVYCFDGVAVTADHIVAKEFFPPEYRDGLPKVPSCKLCNNRKSKLEHYLTAVLPFASDHDTALGSQVEKLTRRLQNNQRLKIRLTSELQSVWIKNDDGRLEDTIALPFEPDKLDALCEYIIKGLIWHEWGVVVPKEYIIKVMTVTQHGFKFFSYLLNLSPLNRVDRSFAGGGFSYTSTRNNEDAAFSVWHIRFYENLLLAGTDSKINLVSNGICALTGPHEIILPLINRFLGIKQTD